MVIVNVLFFPLYFFSDCRIGLKMASIKDKLFAIETEIARKEGELHVASKALHEAKKQRRNAKCTIEEHTRRDAQSTVLIDVEAAIQERELLTQAVMRTQERRQVMQRQLEEHFKRDEDVRQALDKAKNDLKSAARKTMDARHAQRKAEQELRELQSTRRKSTAELETSARRAKMLAEKASRLGAQFHQCITSREKMKQECVALAEQHDSLSEALSTMRETSCRLIAWLEAHQPTSHSPAPRTVAEPQRDSPPPVDTAEQSMLISEYRATIERVLQQAES